MHKRSFIRGAFILTIANIIDRSIGFIFRIILSNMLGPEGMGIYQLVLPIYFVSITFLTSGTMAVTSRFISEEKAKGNKKNVFKILKITFLIVLIFAFAISSLLFFKAKYIAKELLHEPRALLSILIFAPVLIIVASSSVFKGFFQGVINMIPASVSEIVEQIVRISITLYLIQLFTGAKLEYLVAIAIFGISAGEIASFLMYILFYKKEVKVINREMPYDGREWEAFSIAKTLVITAIPITFSKLIVNVVDLAESLIIPSRLVASGLSHSEAMSEFGKMLGMAIPLAYMPAVITSSLSTTVLPAVSEAAALKKWDAVRLRINQAIGYTTLVAFPAIILFLALPDQISQLLYPSSPGVGNFVRVISLGSIFAFLEAVVASTLHGLGKQNVVLRNSIIWLGVCVIGMYYLTSLPHLRLFGYIYSFIFADALILALNMFELIKMTGLKINYLNWFIKPIIASTIMGAIVIIIHSKLLETNVNMWINIFLSILTGFLAYLMLCSALQLPYIEELKKIILLKN
ncbi:stage V sporulation protein B [Thermoanaerobacter italicus Ab9]|uniref:Stage V sporulation protein B n=1 Tax=Thermoanaerobacter italicus (strain DSM 9252 / Ab9) TaxID=580331 RepID=D3T7F0_THEIA|nr:stage V sporulation protein B [Thermoanaerobacter italicus]ADD01882.1 stage V sporulation protein B [Thermoanaerobacter italicus Ab9]